MMFTTYTHSVTYLDLSRYHSYLHFHVGGKISLHYDGHPTAGVSHRCVHLHQQGALQERIKRDTRIESKQGKSIQQENALKSTMEREGDRD